MTATLHVTIQEHIARRNELTLLLSNLADQKMLTLSERQDVTSAQYAEKSELKAYFKELYENDPSLKETYSDYTEIPEFEDELDKLTVKYNQELEELTNWETNLDAQITTASAELEEVKAYLESWKSQQSNNISDEFSFGLNN
ncbi:MAG: hypothetical protein MJ231_03790 [bacterium]|nr:hypothetical protein [bacterium]